MSFLWIGPTELSLSFSAVIFRNTEVGVKASGVGDERCLAGDGESPIFPAALFPLFDVPPKLGDKDLKIEIY